MPKITSLVLLGLFHHQKKPAKIKRDPLCLGVRPLAVGVEAVEVVLELVILVIDLFQRLSDGTSLNFPAFYCY